MLGYCLVVRLARWRLAVYQERLPLHPLQARRCELHLWLTVALVSRYIAGSFPRIENMGTSYHTWSWFWHSWNTL